MLCGNEIEIKFVVYQKIKYMVFYYKVPTTIFTPKIVCLKMNSFSPYLLPLGSPKSHHHDLKPTKIQTYNAP
jgi:hypothetical protein